MNKRKRKSSGKNNPYKGPFQNNRYGDLLLTRKYMKMEVDDPTFNEISQLDTTSDCDYDSDNFYSSTQKREVPKKIKAKKWFNDNIKEIISGTIIAIISAIIIIFLVNHTEKITTNELKIEVVSSDIQKQESKTERIEGDVNQLKTDLKCLDNKVDYNEKMNELKYEAKKKK